MIDFATAAIRLGVALAFGAFVGVEREWRHKHAGLKTMTLVSLGAAAFSMMSDTFGPANHNPAQMAAAVVGGIGFIGAGVIMHRGITVQGVTTAATLWADASVGVASGLGQFRLALVLTIGIVIVQFMLRSAEHSMAQLKRPVLQTARFEMRVDCAAAAMKEVNELWTDFEREAHLEPLRRSLVRESHDEVSIRAVVRGTGEIDVSKIQESLVGVAGVRRVDVRHLGLEED